MVRLFVVVVVVVCCIFHNGEGEHGCHTPFNNNVHFSVARIFKGFGMTIWGVTRRRPTPENRSPDVDVYK